MKLHIGCGKKYLKGYKHVDVIPFDHVDFECDAGKLDIINDESATEIYACHILEHVKRNEVSEVLEEWCRVLKSGGVLRIAVPDFESVVQAYLSGEKIPSLLGLLYGGQTYDYNFHHVAFDFSYIKEVLEEAGFINVERYDWQTFLPSDFDDFSRAYLPHMDFENGRHMSLNVIARKA
jgi:predicted SAM-dependent methyltransferase